jgi:hypothetical protein
MPFLMLPKCWWHLSAVFAGSVDVAGPEPVSADTQLGVLSTLVVPSYLGTLVPSVGGGGGRRRFDGP